MIHTFWAKLNWNCHIHFLVTAWWLTNDNKRRSINTQYIPYEYLKSLRRTLLVRHLREYAKTHFTEHQITEFNILINKLFEKSRFVYCDKKITQRITIIKYIGRYLKRPVIGESRLLNYDWENITFAYVDKYDHKEKLLTIGAIEFLQLLTQHIPDKFFKNIRYGWLFANRCKSKFLALLELIIPGSKKIVIKRRSYRERCMKVFWYDPFLCDCWWEYYFDHFIFDSG